MKLSICLVLLLALLLPTFSQTQTDQQQKQQAVEGEIKDKFETIPAMIAKPFVATPDASAPAEELSTVLGNDLYNSDYFEIIDNAGFPAYTGQVKIGDYKTSRAKYVALLKVAMEGTQVNVEARFYDIQSEQLVVGKVYKWDRKYVRHIAHRFGDEILYRLWGVRGIFTSKLAFSSDRSGNREVWLMDYDGFSQTQVTKSKNINLSPDLSPDGKQVVYTTYRAEEASTGQLLVIYNIYDGKKFTLFSSGTLNSAPAWSSDGTRIAFTSNAKGNAEIFTIGTNGSGLRQITFNRSIDTSPAWNPKSGQIAFTSDRSGNPMVYIMNEDGTNEQRLTYVGEYNESAGWSPDGTKLAYVSRSGINFDIYVVDMASNVVTRLTQNEGSNENPCWSPDSRHIAFASNRTGRYQIWSMLFNGTKLRQLTRDGNNTSPSWAPGE